MINKIIRKFKREIIYQKFINKYPEFWSQKLEIDKGNKGIIPLYYRCLSNYNSYIGAGAKIIGNVKLEIIVE